MDFIAKYSGVVALVILAIMGVSGFFGHGSSALFGSTSCANITCLSGGLRLVTDAGGDFEADVAAVFASTVNITGATTIAGDTTLASTTVTSLKISQLGTRLTQFLKGTGNLTGPCVLIDGASITASTSKAVDCAVANAVAGDTVFVQAATTTKTGGMAGWSIQGASASSTSGFVTVILYNGTGANAVPPTTATSTSYLLLR